MKIQSIISTTSLSVS